MNKLKTGIASLLIVCLTGLSVPMQAFAAIVSTEEAMASSAASGERDRIASFLSRDDVRQSLQAQGVDPQSAIERIATLSDQEVQQLAARIDNAPAGGDILGILFTVFIVLLVTDILGLTKVFPFTRSIR